MSEQYLYSRRVKIPGKEVRRVIGQYGCTIKSIQDQSGAKLAFEGLNSDKYPNGRVLLITAVEEDMVSSAHHLVEELCGIGNVELVEMNNREEEETSLAEAISSTTITLDEEQEHGSVAGEAGNTKEGFLVPLQLVKHVVGHKEENLTSLKASLSLTSLQLGMVCSTSETKQYHLIEICGEEEKVQEAKKILKLLVNHFLHDFPGEDAQLKRINSVMSVASAIDYKGQKQPKWLKKQSAKTVDAASPSTSVLAQDSKPASVENMEQEADLKLKMQMLKIKLLEEQHKFYEKQVEQTDMENYLKRTNLKMPASLTLKYKGKHFELVNKFAAEE